MYIYIYIYIYMFALCDRFPELSGTRGQGLPAVLEWSARGLRMYIYIYMYHIYIYV